MQFQADVLNTQQFRPQVIETQVMGAALFSWFGGSDSGKALERNSPRKFGKRLNLTLVRKKKKKLIKILRAGSRATMQ